MDLTSRLKNQPKYKIGQCVVVTVKTIDSNSGLEFKNKVEAHVSEIRAAGTEKKDTYEYGVTLDMPGCYHNGKRPFCFIIEDSIILK